MVKSTKLRRETLDNFRDMLSNSAKRIHDSQTVNFHDLFSERYKRMDIRPHVHAKLGLTEFCAIYQYAPMEPSSIGYESHLGLFPSRDEGSGTPFGVHLTLSTERGGFYARHALACMVAAAR